MAGRFVWIPRFGGALGGLPVDQVPGCDLRRTGRFRPLGSRTITQTASRARPVQVFSVDAFASRALTRRTSTCRMPPTPPCARSSFLARRQNRMSDVPTCLAPMDIAGQTRATAARSAGRIGLRILGGPLAPFPAPERRPTTPLPRVRTLTPHADVPEAGRGHWPLLRLLAGRTVVCAGGVEVACTESLDTAPASVLRLRAGEEVGLRPYQRRTECEPEPDCSLNAAEPETAQLAPSPLAVRALQ